MATLNSVYGYTEFRPLQEDIVNTILEGADAFVLMPTGGGVSLCFQLPALLSDGMTVVVSPLVALMKDQVDRLRAMGVPATYINSTLEPQEVSARRAAVARGEVKLLYMAPERLMMPSTLDLLAARPPAAFAIDEAHCISEWGHDFRPEYRELTRLRPLFPSSVFAAFTATATTRVRADIVAQLGLQDAASFHGSFDRPNLFYRVLPKQDAYPRLLQYLKGHMQESGIIYCQSRASTESLAQRLCDDGLSAAPYHAGLSAAVRRETHDAFVRDDTRIVVATIAFGMGIDKPDVRFVVHYDLPKNLEGYYQESGRAGRDGEPSDCILFYSYGDVAKHAHFIDEKESPAEQAVAREQLRAVVEWAERQACRRRTLLAYFDEPPGEQAEPCCDVCADPAEETDCTVAAQMLLSCAVRAGERYGLAYLIQVLLGSRDQRIEQAGHDALSGHGVGRQHSKGEWQTLGGELAHRGYIHRDPEQFNVVRVTPLGRDVLFNGLTVSLPLPAAPPPSRDSGGDTESDPELFQRLRTIRKRLADEQSVPPYVVFHDATLRQMATVLPETPEALASIHGIGEHKLSKYGGVFLAEIGAYLRETNAARSPATVAPPRSRGPNARGDSVRETLLSFEHGMSPERIAEARGLALSTVHGHLAAAIEMGHPMDTDRLVPAERLREIEVAVGEMGNVPLGALKERLGEAYGYGEIRIAIATFAARAAGA